MSVIDDVAAVAQGIAFGIPGGGTSLEVADAVERTGGRFYTTRFEGSAALMAGAVGRLTGQPGVAVSIRGPGLANLAAGLATAALEDLPVLAVTEAFGRGDTAARAHKRIDHNQLTMAAVKARAGMSETKVVETLVALAVSERPGPVLLELADTESRIPFPQEPLQGDSDTVLSLIGKARHPVVICGSLSLRRGWSPLLNGLQIPVFSTAGAKGAIDESLPQAAGVYTGAGLDLAAEAAILARADLVVGLGLRSHEVLTSGLKVVSVNIDELNGSPGFSFAAVASVDAARNVLAALQVHPGWGADLIDAANARLRKAMLDGPFLPAQAFEQLSVRWPRARMVLDTGYFCTVGEHFWRVRAPGLYLSSGQGRSMGAALPMAIGASILRRGEPTILAIGDGGIGMFAAELTLAIDERSPLLVVFMRDGTYSSVLERAVAKGLTRRPLTIASPDWVEVAAALGFITHRASNEDEMASFLRHWEPQQGPAFLEVRFDPEPYRAMTRALRA